MALGGGTRRWNHERNSRWHILHLPAWNSEGSLTQLPYPYPKSLHLLVLKKPVFLSSGEFLSKESEWFGLIENKG